MSKVIDSRVVEMSFDNTNFEKNVSESMSTLEKLKAKLKGLDDTSTNLDKVGEAANNIDLNKLGQAIDNINNRFSTMGVIGTTVLQDITQSALGLVKSFGSNLWSRTLGQIKSGGKARATNIAQSKFTLEGMGFKFDDYYEDINNAVAGTAYGFDQAAQAAAVFGASGVKAGEEMSKALRGISGVAAMTGSSYDEIAYVFEKVNGVGKVTGESLNMISGRGLNAAAALATYLNKTEEEVHKMVTKGQIDFKTFAYAMDDAFGEHATAADDTLTGVLTNIRAQLSRIGQTFYEPLFENNSALVEMFKSVKQKIKDIKEYTDPFAKRLANYVLKLARLGKTLIDSIDVKKMAPFFENLVKIFDNLTNAAENLFTNVLSPFFREIKKAFYDVFPELDNGKSLIITLTDKFVDFTGKVRETSKHIGILGQKGSIVRTVFRGIFTIFKTLINILNILLPLISKLATGLAVIITVVANVISNIGNLIAKFLPTFKMIGVNIVEGIAYGILVGIPALFKTIISFVGMVVDKFQSLFLIHSPSALMAALVGVPIALGIAAGIIMGFDAVGTAIKTFLTKLLESAGTDGVVTFGEKIGKIFEGINNTTIGLFDVLASALFKIAEAIKAIDATKLFEHINDINRFLVLGALVILTFQLLKASTWFSAAMYNFARAAKLYVYGRFSVWSKVPEMFESFAVAIAVITGCIIILGKLPYNEAVSGLVRVGIIISGLIGVMLLSGLLIDTSSKIDRLELLSIGLIFLGISSVITSVTLSLLLLKNVPVDTVIGVVGSLVVMMVGLAWAVNQFGMIGSARNAIGYVLSMSMLINAFAKLSLILAIIPEPLVWQSIAVMSALSLMVIGVVGFLVLATKLSGGVYGEGTLDGVAATLLSLSVMFWILTGVMESIAKMTPEEIQTGISTLSKLMFFMTVMIGVINATASIRGHGATTLLGTALTIGGMAVLFRILADTIKTIAAIDQDDIDKAMNVIGSIMFLLIAESIALGFATKAVGIAMAGLAAMVIAMAGAVYLLGTMEEGFAKGLGHLLVILVLCGLINGFVSRLVPADYNPVYKMFLGLAAMVAASAAFVYIVGNMSWKDMTKGMLGLSVLLIGLAGIVSLMNQKNFGVNADKNIKGTVKIIKQVVKSIITIVAAVVLVGLALEKFSNDPVQSLTNGMAAVGMAMLGLMGLLGILTFFKASDIEKINRLAKPIKSLSGAILIIVGSLVILSLIPDPSAIVTGAFSLAIVLGSMMGVIYACKTLSKNQDVKYGAIVAAVLGVLGVAAAIMLITTLIGDKGWENVRDSFLYLIGSIGMIVLALIGLKKYDVDLTTGLTLIAGTMSFLIAAAAFGMLLDQLGSRDWVALDAVATSMFLAIASIVGGMAVIALLMQKMNPGYVVGATIILAALCGELIIVANALKILAGYQWNEIWPALAAMGIAIVGIAIIAGVIGAISLTGAGLVAFAFGLVVLAAAIGELAWTVSILKDASVAFETFGKTLKECFNSKVAKEVKKSIDIMTEGVVDGIKSMAQAIEDNGILAVVAMVALMKNMTTQSAEALGVSSPSTEFYDIGMWVIRGFTDAIKWFGYNPNTGILAVGKNLFQAFIDIVRNVLQTHSNSKEAIDIAKDFIGGFKQGILDNLSSVFIPGRTMGLSLLEGLKSGLSELLGGGLENQINGSLMGMFGDFNISSLLGTGNLSGGYSDLFEGYDWNNFNVSDFKSQMESGNLDLSMLSGDGIADLTENLKAAGYQGDDLAKVLQELGVSLEDIKNQGLDVSKLIGTEEAKNGVAAVSEGVKSLSDRILKGEFKNAPVRWDKMFETLIKEGKTAQQAYEDIAAAQNEVNSQKGVKKRWDAGMVEKSVSDSVKKQYAEQIKANEEAAKKDIKQKKDAIKYEDSALKKRMDAQNKLKTGGKALSQEEVDRLNKVKAENGYYKNFEETMANHAAIVGKQANSAETAAAAQNKQTNALKEGAKAAGEEVGLLEKAAGAVVAFEDSVVNTVKGWFGIKDATEEVAKAQTTVSQNTVSQNEAVKEQAKQQENVAIAVGKTAKKAEEAADNQVKMTDTLTQAAKKTAESTEKATQNQIKQTDTLKEGFAKSAKNNEIATKETANQVKMNDSLAVAIGKSAAKQTEQTKAVKDTEKAYEDASKTVSESSSEAVETASEKTLKVFDALASTLGGSKSSLFMLGSKSAEKITDEFKDSNDKFEEAGRENAKAYEEAFEDELGYYYKNRKGEWEWQSAKNVTPSMGGVGWAYQWRSEGIPSEDMYKPTELTAAQKAKNENNKKQLVEDAKSTVNEIGKAIAGTAESNTEKVLGAGRMLGNLITKGTSEATPKVKTEGEKGATQYAEGFSTDKVPKSKYGIPAQNAKSELGSKKQIEEYMKLGENSTKGYANGMTSKPALEYVRKAGNTVANTSKASMQTALDEHSPSKVMYGIGAFAIKGFINGLLSMVGQVANASATLGEASLNTITPVVSGIQNAIDSGLDITPVITPVINGSNIQNDLNNINSILGQRHIASITENIQATQDYKIQESIGLENRMNGLRDAVDTLSTAMLSQPAPEVTANVVLQGEANGIFRAVQSEDNIYKKMHGASAFG